MGPITKWPKVQNEGATDEGLFTAQEFNDLYTYILGLPTDVKLSSVSLKDPDTGVVSIPFATNGTAGVITGQFYQYLSQMYTDYNNSDWVDASELATVATSGSYNDLYNRPVLGTAASRNVGQANGVAELDANGKVPSSQLPSYVDDVVEFTQITDTLPDGSSSPRPSVGQIWYLKTSITDYTGKKFYRVSHIDPVTFELAFEPESGKVYVNTTDNTTWRWSGVVLSPIKGDLALGETSSTAYRGDRGKIAYDHSQGGTSTGHVTSAERTAWTEMYEDWDSSPEKISEMADELNIVQQDLAGKVDKVTGKGLSTNDYTTAEKDKLAALNAGYVDETIPVNGETLVAGKFVKVRNDMQLGTADLPKVTDGVDGLMPYSAYTKLQGITVGTQFSGFDNTEVNGEDLAFNLKGVDLTSYAVKSELATVATSGSYNDLTDKPDIPEGAIVYHELGQNTDGAIDQNVVTEAFATKVDKVTGKGLSTYDYDGTERSHVSTAYSHVSRTDNPHSVTKSQVGLGNVDNVTQIPLSQKGTANGVAELDANGKVPSSQLPAYVDDVIDFNGFVSVLPTAGSGNLGKQYIYTGTAPTLSIHHLYKCVADQTTHTFLWEDEGTAEENGKIFVNVEDNTTWRWSGTTFTPIKGDLALGETSSTAYRGDRGKIAYDHSQGGTSTGHVTSAERTAWDEMYQDWDSSPEKISEMADELNIVQQDLAGKVDKVTGKGLSTNDYDGTERSHVSTAYSHVSRTDNPHSVTKSQVGLGNVDNVKQIPLSQKGTANGVAELDANGKVPSSQLPAYVDDVIDFNGFVSVLPTAGSGNLGKQYIYTGTAPTLSIHHLYKCVADQTTHTFLWVDEGTAEENGKIFVNVEDNTTWRWSGTTFTPIKGDLALGETSSTAYRGDRGKIAYDHSQGGTSTGHVTSAERTAWTEMYEDWDRSPEKISEMADELNIVQQDLANLDGIASKSYSSWSKTTSSGIAWFPIMRINVNAVVVTIDTPYQTGLIFTATHGYGSYGKITILGGGGVVNTSYACISGIRLVADTDKNYAWVEVALNAAATNVGVHIKVLSARFGSLSGTYFPDTLSESTAEASTVADSFVFEDMANVGIYAKRLYGALDWSYISNKPVIPNTTLRLVEKEGVLYIYSARSIAGTEIRLARYGRWTAKNPHDKRDRWPKKGWRTIASGAPYVGPEDDQRFVDLYLGTEEKWDYSDFYMYPILVGDDRDEVSAQVLARLMSKNDIAPGIRIFNGSHPTLLRYYAPDHLTYYVRKKTVRCGINVDGTGILPFSLVFIVRDNYTNTIGATYFEIK